MIVYLTEAKYIKLFLYIFDKNKSDFFHNQLLSVRYSV